MQEYNKRNLLFLLGVFFLLAVVFLTVVMITYVDKGGLWSVFVPTIFIVGSVVVCFKKLLKFKDEKIEGGNEGK